MNGQKINKRETLKDLPLFSAFDIEQLRLIMGISRVIGYSKNEIIFIENDAYKGFYIALKGRVKVYKTSTAGKEVILHIIKPPQPFADVPLFEGGNYPANAQAIDECLLLFIPKNEFIELIKNNHDISLKIIAGFAKRLREMSKKIEYITLKEVSDRLAKYLIDEINQNGTIKLTEPFVKLSISKANVASIIGTITETLSRSLKKLQDDKVIRVDGKKIFIRDIKKLKELAG